MTEIHDLAARLAVLRIIGDLVKRRVDYVKTELSDAMTVGDRVTATLPDASKIASVTYTTGRTQARVVDESALTAWVSEHHPSEVVSRVRDSYRAHLLERVRAHGGLVDDATGEVTGVPGVEVTTGDPYLTVRPTDGAYRVVAGAHRRGELSLGDDLTPTLGAGEQR